jgi:UDP-3-O-acyl-N-acetylglucosamine deacetylase
MIGHLVAHRGGHALHTAFAAQVMAERDSWTLVDSVPAGGFAAGAPVVADAKS